MKHFLVYQELEQAALKWPDLSAIFDEHGAMSFAELWQATEACKIELLQLGVHSGMGLGVMARNSRQFIILVFGVLGCGASVLPLSHQLKRPELEEIIEHAQLHAVLDDFSGIQPLPDTESHFFTTSNADVRLAFTKTAPEFVFAGHVVAPAFVRYTSGTTGTSKGVVISNEAVLERTSAANKSLCLDTQSRVVWVLPMAYHFVVSIVLYIRVGAAIIIVKNFMAKTVIEMC